MHLLTSLGRYVGGRKLLRSWLLFYYLRPLVGVGLAILVYFVLRTGVLAPGANLTGSNFNVYGILAFAALAGLFSRQAIEKLADVFDTLFQKTKQDISSRPAGQLFGTSAGRADTSARLPESSVPSSESFGVEEVKDEDE